MKEHLAKIMQKRQEAEEEIRKTLEAVNANKKKKGRSKSTIHGTNAANKEYAYYFK